MSGIVVLGVLTVIVPIAFAIHKQKQGVDRQREADLQRLSKALDMELVPSAARQVYYDTLRGEFDGMRVEVVLVRHRTDESDLGTVVRVYFETPLATGIPSGAKEGFSSFVRNPKGALAAVGDLAEAGSRVHGLLDSSGARDVLRPGGYKNVRVSDTSLRVVVDRRKPVIDTSKLRDAIDAAVEAAGRIYVARFEMPVTPAEQELRWVFVALAKQLDLRRGRGDLSARGPYRTGTLQIEAFFDGLVPSTRFVYEAAALPFRVRLVQDTLRAALTGEQDIAVGDVAFDRRFLVQGEPEDQVRRLFTPAVRVAVFAAWEAAHRLHEDARVSFEDGRFEVTWPARLAEDTAVAPLARSVADALEAMQRTQRSGAYR